jgi:GR25 family glycosyltransferase involved in LPS biosynthesis
MLHFCVRRLNNNSRASSFFDGVFVVNLNRRPDRWKSIVAQCERAGVAQDQLERVEAYDGSLLFSPKDQTPCVALMQQHQRGGEGGVLLSQVALDRLSPQLLPPSQRVWGMDLSPGAVGCALSHVHIWCDVLERGLQRALVLEDDCLLPPKDLGAELQRPGGVYDSLPRDWGFVFLSGLDPERQCRLLRVAKCSNSDEASSRYICRVPRIYRTTNCYMINARGARDLLQTCVPFTFQLDTAMTTMLVDRERNIASVGGSGMPDPALLSPEDKAEALSTPAMLEEYASLIPCYCVDPPLAAQATRFGSDIQDPHPNADHDFAAEEQSRMQHAGIV